MKKIFAIFTLVVLMSLLFASALYAETENYIINLSGGNAGYNISAVTDPDRIPLLVIKPEAGAILDGFSFELRLSKAVWDLDTFKSNRIANYGSVSGDGVFTPDISDDGYLTGARNPQGGRFKLKISSKANTAVVTLEPGFPIENGNALYIPLLAQITGSGASVEIYSDFAPDMSLDGIHVFTIPGINGTNTQIRISDIVTFSRTVLLPDIVIREMSTWAITGGTLTITAEPGYQWVDIDQIRLSGVASGDKLEVASVAYEPGKQTSSANQSVLKIELRRTGDPSGPGELVIRNLRLSATRDNTGSGSASVTFSGCNILKETVKVADKYKEEYIFSTVSKEPAKLIAGYNPADPLADGLKTVKVILEETSPGVWRSNGTISLTLPEGVSARAVIINTANLLLDLSADTVIRRIDANAFRLSGGDSGIWTLSEKSLTIAGAVGKQGQKIRLEMTFYVSAGANFVGKVGLTTGGSGLSHSETVIIAEVADKNQVPTVALTIGSKLMTAGDRTIEMDVAPFIEDGYTLVPVSFVATALGLPEGSVVWEESSRTVTIKVNGKVSVLTIDSDTLKIDGVSMTIPKAPVIRNGRTFLPFRVLGEQILKVRVGWDEASRTAAFYDK